MDGIKTIVKRDGRTVEFNIDKIANAKIGRAHV